MTWSAVKSCRSQARVLFLCGLAHLFLDATAFAKSTRNDSRKAREDAAKKACAIGDVGKGIDLLGELYIESNDPVFVHNQARCYQQNGQWEKAINRFEEYLRKSTDLNAENKSSVEKYISECQAKIDKITPTPMLAPPAQVALTPPAVASVQAPPETARSTPPKPAEDVGRGMRVGGIVTAAVGLAALAAGVAFNLAERNLHNQMSSDASKNTADNENRRSTYQTASVIGYSVGAAALVTGTVICVLGSRQGDTADKRFSWVVDFVPGTASLGLKGRF